MSMRAPLHREETKSPTPPKPETNAGKDGKEEGTGVNLQTLEVQESGSSDGATCHPQPETNTGKDGKEEGTGVNNLQTLEVQESGSSDGATCHPQPETNTGKDGKEEGTGVNLQTLEVQESGSSHGATCHPQPLCIVIFGKKGSGKKTLAGQLVESLGQDVPLDIREIDAQVIPYTMETKDIQRAHKYYTDKLKDVSHINLLIFLYQNGRFTREEQTIFKSVMQFLRPNAKEISALVIGYCEDLSTTAREKLIADFKTDDNTKDIAEFMKRGIYCVGFPDLQKVNPQLHTLYRETIEKDCMQILKVVNASKEQPELREIIIKPPMLPNPPDRNVYCSSKCTYM